MGDISVFFDRSEFECKCGCGLDTVDAELLSALEDLRTYFDSPVTVVSGHRCEAHNRSVGGRPKSKHLMGRAADVTVLGVSPAAVYDYLCDRHPGKFGIILYPGFVHVDSRSERYRERKAMVS